MHRKPRIAVLYHYLHPDDVISARHFDGLCLGLAERGWEVEALPSNRGCRDESRTYPLREDWQGISLRRVWRPRFLQATGPGRLLNAAWMAAAWSSIAARPASRLPDVVLIGTDPVMSVGIAPVLKTRKGLKVAHWVYDLYPEAAVADGLLAEDSLPVKAAIRIAGAGYRSCDLVADIGPCMRRRLDAYGHGSVRATLVPWALDEPGEVRAPDPGLRKKLFGEARLGVLYSGNFGRAHGHRGILDLAKKLEGESIHFCFAVRGNRAGELKRAVGSGRANVTVVDYFPDDSYVRHLEAADVHVASLRPGWCGVVVPSKFFGSLALGRPVLFDGPGESGIAEWIRKYEVGWVLGAAGAGEALAGFSEDRSGLDAMWRRCHRVYGKNFGRKQTLDRWDELLRGIVQKG